MADPPRRPSAEYSLPGPSDQVPQRLTSLGKLAAPRPVHARRPEPTLTGVAPPPQGSPRPQPPPPLPLPHPPVRPGREEYRRSMSPAPWERDSVVDRVEAEVSKRGDRLVRAPESTPLPSPPVLPGVTPSIMARAERLPLAKWLIIVGVASASLATLVTAIGSQIVGVIVARRPADLGEMQKQIDGLKAAREGENGVALEAKARREKDAEHERDIEDLKAKMQRAEPAGTIQGIAPAPTPK